MFVKIITIFAISVRQLLRFAETRRPRTLIVFGMFLFFISFAEAGTITIRIEAPAEEDCDIGSSPVSPNNPLCGFLPRAATITAGDKIMFINNDSARSHEPASNDHGSSPNHNIYPDLNLETDADKADGRLKLDPGQSWTTPALTRVGDWGIHDHLDISFVGQISILPVSSQSGCVDCVAPGVKSNFQVGLIDSQTPSTGSGQAANISWQTDELSLTRLEYGKTEGYGIILEPDKVFRTSHSITLKNLKPETRYYFRMGTEDKIGNKNFTNYANQTFLTLALTVKEAMPLEEASPPVPVLPIAEKSITEMTAAEIQRKIAEIQQEIIGLLQQLIQIIQEQIAIYEKR